MKVQLTQNEAVQLIALGLEHEESPLRIQPGYEPRDIKIAAASGNVSFDLVEAQDEDEESTGNPLSFTGTG